jgi:hypothetical protein
MFSFFWKKETKTKIIDRVFLSSEAKYSAILQQICDPSNVVIVTWFEESHGSIEARVQSNHLNAEIYLAREIAAHNIQGKTILFAEHHPLITKQKELLQKLRLKEAVFYSALDEPFFKHFGGDRMISMMEKLGLSGNEAIEHHMITNAIKNVQEKIAKEVIIEHSAQSQAEWFSKNIVN